MEQTCILSTKILVRIITSTEVNNQASVARDYAPAMMNPLFPGHWGSQRCPKSIWHYDIVGGHSENLPRSYLTHSCLCTLVTDYAIMRPSWRGTLFWFIWLRILVLLYVFNRISLGGKMLFLVEKLRQPNSSVHSTGLTSYMSRDNTQTELSVVSQHKKAQDNRHEAEITPDLSTHFFC